MAIIVTYRRTRRLSMRIAQNGDVRVSAPIGLARHEVEAFIEKNYEWMEMARKKVANRQQQRHDFYAQLPLDTPAQRRDATQRLKTIVAPLLQRHACEMGVQPAAVTFRRTISRWGSCNHRTRRISLSLYLLLLPDWCIEHVVVHELAHLLVPRLDDAALLAALLATLLGCVKPGDSVRLIDILPVLRYPQIPVRTD